MKKRSFQLATLAATLVATFPAQAAVVFSDNFDSYAPASSVPWSGGGTWTTGNSVDLVKSGEYNLTCAGGGGNCVDLSGSSPGSISKVLSLAAGTYLLSFDYTGNQLDSIGGPWPPAGFTASIGSLTANIGPLANNSNVFQSYSNWFTVNGSPVTLTFSQQGGNNYRGSILDNVLISSVPEPTTWAMMLLGFGMIGFGVRRRTGGKSQLLAA
jgi:hypothetical protein